MEYNKPRYNPKIHHRRSIRLKGYDYSQAGLYFITICCQYRICRFGEIVLKDNIPTMILNDAGKMFDDEWLALVDRFPNIALHEYIVMPNHFHCILEIVSNDAKMEVQNGDNEIGRPVGVPLVDTQIIQPNDAETSMGTQNDNGRPTTGTQNDVEVPTKNKTIGDMMDAFKSITTVKYINGVKNMGWDRFDGKLLQRDYYEHIIRDEESYYRISEYIKNNPVKWMDDKFYTA